MTFDDYQKQSRATARYPDIEDNFIFPTLGLLGEAGEVAEKVKKLIRDKEVDTPSAITGSDRTEIKKELGDVLWYLSQLASELGLSLSDVAQTNIDKLQSRFLRDQINGEGDNR